MTVFEILNMRYEFEEITLNLRVPGDRKPGTLDNMKWFLDNGYEKNKRKPGVKRATEIARTIVDADTRHRQTRKK